MEKLNITKVYVDDKKRDGSPLINKYGKPYYIVTLVTKEYSDKIRGMTNFAPTDWEGTVKELDVYDEEYQGKTYKKFRMPKASPGMSDAEKHAVKGAYEYAKAANDNILLLIRRLEASNVLTDKVKYPEPEFPPESMPF